MILKITKQPEKINKRFREKFDVILQCDNCKKVFNRVVSQKLLDVLLLRNFQKCQISCLKYEKFEKVCDICSKVVSIDHRDLSPLGFYFCSKKCVYKAQESGGITYEIKKKLCFEKHGVDFPMSRDEIKKRRTDNLIQKYGVSSTFALDEVKEKMKKTSQEKYGVNVYSQTEEFKQKIIETNIKRFGHKSPIENPDILEKRRKTNIRKYGGESTLSKSSTLRKEFEDKMIAKYGYHTISLVPSFITSSMNKKLLKSCGKTWEEYKNELPENLKYRREVDKITKAQPVQQLENHNKKGEYHLDHKFSVAAGFRLGISPFVIGNIVNLEYIPALDNMIKSDKCSISKEELLEKFTTKKENDNEQKI